MKCFKKFLFGDEIEKHEKWYEYEKFYNKSIDKFIKQKLYKDYKKDIDNSHTIIEDDLIDKTGLKDKRPYNDYYPDKCDFFKRAIINLQLSEKYKDFDLDYKRFELFNANTDIGWGEWVRKPCKLILTEKKIKIAIKIR